MWQISRFLKENPHCYKKKKKNTQNTAVNLMLTLSQKISRKLLFPIFFFQRGIF